MSQGPRWFVICSQVVVPAAASGKWWARFWWAGHFEMDLWKMKRNRGSIPKWLGTWGYDTQMTRHLGLCHCQVVFVFFGLVKPLRRLATLQCFLPGPQWLTSGEVAPGLTTLTTQRWHCSRRNLDRHWTVVPCGLHWASTSVIVSGGSRAAADPNLLSGQGSFPTAYASRWDAAKRLVQTNANALRRSTVGAVGWSLKSFECNFWRMIINCCHMCRIRSTVGYENGAAYKGLWCGAGRFLSPPSLPIIHPHLFIQNPKSKPLHTLQWNHIIVFHQTPFKRKGQSSEWPIIGGQAIWFFKNGWNERKPFKGSRSLQMVTPKCGSIHSMDV